MIFLPSLLLLKSCSHLRLSRSPSRFLHHPEFMMLYRASSPGLFVSCHARGWLDYLVAIGTLMYTYTLSGSELATQFKYCNFNKVLLFLLRLTLFVENINTAVQMVRITTVFISVDCSIHEHHGVSSKSCLAMLLSTGIMCAQYCTIAEPLSQCMFEDARAWPCFAQSSLLDGSDFRSGAWLFRHIFDSIPRPGVDQVLLERLYKRTRCQGHLTSVTSLTNASGRSCAKLIVPTTEAITWRQCMLYGFQGLSPAILEIPPSKGLLNPQPQTPPSQPGSTPKPAPSRTPHTQVPA